MMCEKMKNNTKNKEVNIFIKERNKLIIVKINLNILKNNFTLDYF